jgi:hypothetical protein
MWDVRPEEFYKDPKTGQWKLTPAGRKALGERDRRRMVAGQPVREARDKAECQATEQRLNTSLPVTATASPLALSGGLKFRGCEAAQMCNMGVRFANEILTLSFVENDPTRKVLNMPVNKMQWRKMLVIYKEARSRFLSGVAANSNKPRAARSRLCSARKSRSRSPMGAGPGARVRNPTVSPPARSGREES